MKIDFNDLKINTSVWKPSVGRVADCFSYDTETTAVDDPQIIQDYVVGSVCDGENAYFVRRQDLQAFWEVHQDCRVFMHTASFDLEVTTKACGFDFLPMVDTGRIIDISILYRLLKTAKTGDVAHRYSLDWMTKELLGVELDKDETVRKGFGQFLEGGSVNYQAIPPEYLVYAALDATATFVLGCRMELDVNSLQMPYNPTQNIGFGDLGHDIQLKGDVALRAIEHRGMCVDLGVVEKLDQELVAGIDKSKTVLAQYGYVPGRPGTKKVFNGIVAPLAKERGLVLYVTPKSRDACQSADALAPMADHEFVGAFLEFKEQDKLRSTYVDHLRESGGHIFPRYNLLVRTGRTSCSKPNIQNLPRKGGVRECLIPSPGHVLIACDYSTLELCTLAQICFSRYGQSHMRELINAGVDLHRHVAAMILGKPADQISKEDRQKAKAVNFALPGGMSAKSLGGYAASAYGVHLTVEEAESWQTKWVDLFPEMELYLDTGNTLDQLGAELDLDSFPGGHLRSEAAAAIMMRVAGGKSESSMGREFSPEEINWAWEQIENSPANRYKITREAIKTRQGSRLLQRLIVPGTTVSIPTGRVKSNCRRNQELNMPFQGLASDGAKLALYELNRAGYRVVAFIHDEVLVEVPERDDYREPAEDISRIMIAAMKQVCPDVEIRTEFAVMRRWDKAAKAVYDAQGRLIPFG
ncbi:MAG: DNA polymerase [bacterium]